MADISSVWWVVICMLFASEGLRRLVKALLGGLEWMDSQTWLRTQGRVIKSEIQLVYLPRYRRGSRVFPDTPAYRPEVVYEYSFRGQTYQSEKIYAGQNSLLLDFKSADYIVRSFPARTTVTVFCHPDKPQRSALNTRTYKYNVGDLVTGFIYILVGFGMLAIQR